MVRPDGLVLVQSDLVLAFPCALVLAAEVGHVGNPKHPVQGHVFVVDSAEDGRHGLSLSDVLPTPTIAAAASTASISAARSPCCSRTCRPTIVVPPGLVTRSRNTAGCSPVESNIWAGRTPSVPPAEWRPPAAVRADAAVAQGFNDREYIGGPRSGQPGHGVQQLLFEFQRQTDGTQQGRHLLAVLRGRSGPQGVSGNATPHEARRARHHADDSRRAQRLAQSCQSNARQNGHPERGRISGWL